MKKLILLCVLFAFTGNSFAQTETFDLITYTPPAGWKKEVKENSYTSFTISNQQTKNYCQIFIMLSIESKGGINEDFDNEWQNLVVKNYKVSESPKLTEPTLENKWKTKSGLAPFTFNNGNGIAMLTTISGYNKAISIVTVTNSTDYMPAIQSLLESIEMKIPDKVETNQQQPTNNQLSPAAIKSSFTFNTTNFDDGWTSTVQEDWVEVTKGNIKVLIHYPNKNADAYNSVLLDGLKNAWNVLVAPKYSSASNFEFKPITGWQSIEFAEADMVEKNTSKTVHVVLYKMGYSNGSGRYLEFITAKKSSFEQEFGSYHETTYGWENMEKMANYNKFAVAASDLNGKWTNDFSGMTQYVNAYTGADAGANTHASNQNFEFGAGNTYKWDLAVASGFVGNIKFQSVKSNGKFSVPNNWQVSFSDIEGKPKTYNVQFTCIKGARVLWIDGTGFGKKE